MKSDALITAAADPVAYGRALLAAASSLDTAGLIRLHLELAGTVVEVYFSDPEYAALCMRNLVWKTPCDADRVDFRLFMLDADSLAWSQPAPWPTDRFDRVRFNCQLSAAGLRGAYLHDPRVWQFFDAGLSLGVQLIRRPGGGVEWESGAPLRTFLHWIQGLSENYLCHAGSVGYEGRGVLLVGAGGAGKSGTTLAAVCGGLDTVGDDYCLVHEDVSGVFAQPLFRIFKQDPAGVRRVLGADAGALGRLNWQGKYELHAQQMPRDPFVRSLVIEALVLPSITRGEEVSSFQRVAPGMAMRALASSSFQLPDGERAGIAFAASLCRRLPCVTMHLSENADEIAAALARFVKESR